MAGVEVLAAMTGFQLGGDDIPARAGSDLFGHQVISDAWGVPAGQWMLRNSTVPVAVSMAAIRARS